MLSVGACCTGGLEIHHGGVPQSTRHRSRNACHLSDRGLYEPFVVRAALRLHGTKVVATLAADVEVFQTEADARKAVTAFAGQKIEKARGVLDPYQARAAGNLGYVAGEGDPSTAIASCGPG